MTCTGWMRLQTGRLDGVGDLARLAAIDGDFPAGCLGYRAWESHLDHKSAGLAMFWALKRAWREYRGRE